MYEKCKGLHFQLEAAQVKHDFLLDFDRYLYFIELVYNINMVLLSEILYLSKWYQKVSVGKKC